ncbi:MAG: patatin-like phospholipase family protein [Alicyclobacillus sp.]|nr:patatin-like phospholipase family protein [Alicyclobacillus sp.]
MGVALSGGTFKAAAHIGVLAALEQLGVTPHCLAGTSAGSFVAALYAHGYSTREMQEMVKHFSGWPLVDYGFPILSSLLQLARHRWLKTPAAPNLIPSGILRGQRLQRYFASALQDRAPVRPFYIVATDLISGKPVVFSNDEEAIAQRIAHFPSNIASAVAASCALPGIFRPVPIGQWVLIDGAFRHYVPVEILRMVGCDKIIAVNLYHLDSSWRPETILHVLVRSFEILLQETIDNDVEGRDLITLQPLHGQSSWSSFASMSACLRAGRMCVWNQRNRIAEFLRTKPPDAHSRRLHVARIEFG